MAFSTNYSEESLIFRLFNHFLSLLPLSTNPRAIENKLSSQTKESTGKGTQTRPEMTSPQSFDMASHRLIRQESIERKYISLRHMDRNWSDFKKACILVQQFLLNDTKLCNIRDMLDFSMKEGLDMETHKRATVKMLPSFVRHLPDGHEQGTFVALDLGGTNFRVLLIDISDEQIDQDSQIYRIPQDMMQGTGEALFDHIAKCMCDFINRMGFSDKLIKCGFTFSFPCQQSAINSASLITWTKGFCASGVEGQDVVQLLEKSLAKRNEINVDIVAVVNDTVGTMMSCAFEDHSCQIGLIAGTGSNACYME